MTLAGWTGHVALLAMVLMYTSSIEQLRYVCVFVFCVCVCVCLCVCMFYVHVHVHVRVYM